MQTRAVAVKVMRSLVDSAYSLEGEPTGFLTERNRSLKSYGSEETRRMKIPSPGKEKMQMERVWGTAGA